MINKKRFSLFVLALAALSLSLLTGCNKGNEPSAEVIEKFQKAVSKIESGDVSGTIKMKGSDEKGNVDFSGDVDVAFDRKGSDRKADVSLVLSGSTMTEGRSFSGTADLDIISIGQEFFFKLNKLEASDDSLARIKPILDSVANKWLHIAKEFIPESIRGMQNDTPEQIKKDKELKKLFAGSKMLIVNKEYPQESLNGKLTYHYGVAFSPEGIKDYVRKAADINKREITPREIEDAASFAESVKNMELWIGIDDYYLYKGKLEMGGGAEDPSVDMSIIIDFEGDKYNKKVSVVEPDGAEEFNPAALYMMMGNQAAPATSAPAGGAENIPLTLPDGTTGVMPPLPDDTLNNLPPDLQEKPKNIPTVPLEDL